jgi:hypothetical protein
MIELCRLIWFALVGLFRSRASLEIKILALRQQINVLRRSNRASKSRMDKSQLTEAAGSRGVCIENFIRADEGQNRLKWRNDSLCAVVLG